MATERRVIRGPFGKKSKPIGPLYTKKPGIGPLYTKKKGIGPFYSNSNRRIGGFYVKPPRRLRA